MALNTFNLNCYLSAAMDLANQAGISLIKFWHGTATELKVSQKNNNTPATAADLAAHQILTEGLQQLTPNLPIISEEGEWPSYEERRKWQNYWLLDPLDGTRGFIAHLPQFTINIALIVNQSPALGIIYLPLLQTYYYAIKGQGAFKQVVNNKSAIHILPKPEDHPWRIVIGEYSKGRRISEQFRGKYSFELLHANSAVKFGWLAEGRADIYPRFGAISEWDTAAGQCILTEAGGIVVDLHGQTLQYNRQDSLLTPEFIALADPRWLEQCLKILND